MAHLSVKALSAWHSDWTRQNVLLFHPDAIFQRQQPLLPVPSMYPDDATPGNPGIPFPDVLKCPQQPPEYVLLKNLYYIGKLL